MAKIVRTEAFIRGVVFGSTVTLIASLISNNYGMDPFSGTYTLVGLFGSKNQLGLFAEITVLLSLLSTRMKQNIFKRIFYCYIPLCIALVCLYLCRSATSNVSLAAVIVFIICVYVTTRLPVKYRSFTFFSSAVWICVASIIGFSLNVQQLLFKSIGKDSTLTGRTILWDHGMKVGWESPIIGHGYSAFWVQSNPLAEQLWYDFGIYSRAGFHFHDLYIELFVELGLVGLLIMLSVITASFFKSLSLTLRHGMALEYIFPLSVSFMFIIRSFVEVDIMNAFGIGTILYFSIIPRLATYQRENGGNTAKTNSSKFSEYQLEQTSGTRQLVAPYDV